MNVRRATISPKFYRFPPHNNFPYRPNDALCYGYCRPGQLAGEVDACPDCRANCILQLLQENMSKMNMHLASCSLYLASPAREHAAWQQGHPCSCRAAPARQNADTGPKGWHWIDPGRKSARTQWSSSYGWILLSLSFRSLWLKSPSLGPEKLTIMLLIRMELSEADYVGQSPRVQMAVCKSRQEYFLLVNLPWMPGKLIVLFTSYSIDHTLSQFACRKHELYTFTYFPTKDGKTSQNH